MWWCMNNEAVANSRYFERFKRLAQDARGEEAEELGNLMVMKGDMLLVERLPPVETKVKIGGLDIIIADAKTHKETWKDQVAEFGIVLMTGPGQMLEDGTIIPPEARPGDVILLTHRVDWYSQFGALASYEPNTIGRVRDSEVSIFFTDYKKTFDILNG